MSHRWLVVAVLCIISAFGTVYKAKHKDSGITMALKVINTKGKIDIEGDNLVSENNSTLEDIRLLTLPHSPPHTASHLLIGLLGVCCQKGD
jgi:serine/threonine protein kinase